MIEIRNTLITLGPKYLLYNDSTNFGSFFGYEARGRHTRVSRTKRLRL